MIHFSAIFNNSVNNWSMRGSSFKQIKLSQSLGYLFCSPQTNPAPAIAYGKSQFFWSYCRQLSFSTSQRVKRKICVQKVISYKEQKLSQCTGKHNYVIKSEENSDYYYLSNRKMIEVVFSSRVSLLIFYRLQLTLYGRVGNSLVEIYER